MIVCWLKQIYYFQNKNIKYQLLYKGTKNGDKSLNFHTKVDGIKNTLTLVKSKKGIRFGGFTSEIWNQIGKQEHWIQWEILYFPLFPDVLIKKIPQ